MAVDTPTRLMCGRLWNIYGMVVPNRLSRRALENKHGRVPYNIINLISDLRLRMEITMKF